MKNHLDVILGLLAIAGMFSGLIWRLASIKSELEKETDRVYDELSNRIFRLENDLRVHLTEYSGKKEFFEYHIHGLEEKLDHKFKRCWDEIKQHQAYLVKHGFVPRE